MVTELGIMVRLSGKDYVHFEEAKKKTKIEINAELMRVAFRWWYECMLQDKAESTPQPKPAFPTRLSQKPQ